MVQHVTQDDHDTYLGMIIDCVFSRLILDPGRIPDPHGAVYLAGPMTGIPEYNFPAFHEAAIAWRAAGWRVENPAENFGGRVDLPRTTYIREDLRRLLTVDAVAFLPGWQHSRGARLEAMAARELELAMYAAVPAANEAK